MTLSQWAKCSRCVALTTVSIAVVLLLAKVVWVCAELMNKV